MLYLLHFTVLEWGHSMTAWSWNGSIQTLAGFRIYPRKPQSLGGGGRLCRVQVNSEQISLAEAGEQQRQGARFTTAVPKRVVTCVLLAMAVSASQPAEIGELSWGIGSDHRLKAEGASSINSLIGQHHCLKSDVSDYRELVEVTEKGSHIGELWQIEHEVCCDVLDTLQIHDSIWLSTLRSGLDSIFDLNKLLKDDKKIKNKIKYFSTDSYAIVRLSSLDW